MDDVKTASYAAFGAVYGFDKGGVVGAVAGGALAGGVVFLDNSIGGGSDGSQNLRANQMDVASLDIRDVDLGNGQTAQVAGFAVTAGGEAHSIYFVEGSGYAVMGNDGQFAYLNGEDGPQVSGGAINSLTATQLSMK